MVDAATLAAFKQFDADESGSIDAQELRLALEATGLSVDGEQVAYMLRKYDDDRGATLDIEEFAALVHDLRSASGSETQARLNLRTHPKVVEALKAWWTAAIRSSGARLGRPEWQSSLSLAEVSGEEPQLNHEQYVAVPLTLVHTHTRAHTRALPICHVHSLEFECTSNAYTNGCMPSLYVLHGVPQVRCRAQEGLQGDERGVRRGKRASHGRDRVGE